MMDHNFVVQANNVSKKFCRDLKKSLWYGLGNIGREIAGCAQGADQLRSEEFWALRDISFVLGRGEALGLLGKNGAGKTTLLRMLNGLMRPDLGSIRLVGKIAPLIELGAGFAPVLSGRENIYVNGAILGLSTQAVDGMLDRIIEFAELREFIDVPVQSYSEGMKARLGFAVAAHLSPDVMLVDEVLAVGDLSFQRKCIQHMENYLNRGGALIFVSHNMHLVQSICQRCLVLQRGEMILQGQTAEAIEVYSKLNDSTVANSSSPRASVGASVPVAIDRIDIEPCLSLALRPGGSTRINMHYRSTTDVGPVTWGFSLWTNDSEVRIATSLAKYQGKLQRLRKGQGRFSCIIHNLPLVAGRYRIRAGIYDIQSGWPIARFGWEGSGGKPFEIEDVASEANSRHRIDNDIVDLKVDWLD
jgi:lipopolysaccharide transport system ATP-binding protein